MNQDLYPGQISLDGVVRTHSVRAQFFGTSIHLSDGEKRIHGNDALVLSPFGSNCILEASVTPVLGKLTYRLKAREWHIKGTNVGEYRRGPTGHPADGEFELRPVTAFSASASYTSRGITLEFAGETEKGLSVCYFAKTLEALDLPRWRFHIRFQVPREGVQSFLGLREESLEGVLELLDAG